MRIIRALEDKAYDTRTCALLLYALQIGCSNLKRVQLELPAAKEEQDSLAAILLRKLEDQFANPETAPSP